MAPLVWLLACTVMLSPILSLMLSSSGASSSKMANGLLLCECCWGIGCKRRMFEGTVGSCDVVGIQDGLRVGGGATLFVLVCVTLGDGPNVGTLGSGVVGNRRRVCVC